MNEQTQDSFQNMLADYLDLLRIDKKLIDLSKRPCDKPYIIAAIDRMTAFIKHEQELYTRCTYEGLPNE
jgi:hypothetical protein